MGLLDIFQSTGDPERDKARNLGLLQAGLSLLSSKDNLGGALGQAGMAGLQGAQQYRDQQYQNQMRQSQLEEIKRKKVQADQEEQFRANLPSPLSQANQAAFQTSGLPLGTVGSARVQPKVDPTQELLYGATKSGVLPVSDYIQSLKPAGPIKLAPGESLVQPGTYKPLYTNPKEKEDPSAVREYLFAKAQGYGGSFEKWRLDERRAGAANLSVNTGQKGFDNTLKLRGDFRSEPIYKAHQEVSSAHAQIKQALQQQSPAGDLAGATKVMKILDPGSVVRESELGMAMAASGLLDRVQNYASMVVNGTKLTPDQRKDFQKLADALYGESVKAYNAKRGEYAGISDRNKLNTDDVVGPAAAELGNDGWGIKRLP